MHLQAGTAGRTSMTHLLAGKAARRLHAQDPFFFNLVSEAPAVHGSLTKAGMLPIGAWTTEHFSFAPFHRWLAAHGLAHEQMAAYGEAEEGLASRWQPSQAKLPVPLSYR